MFGCRDSSALDSTACSKTPPRNRLPTANGKCCETVGSAKGTFSRGSVDSISAVPRWIESASSLPTSGCDNYRQLLKSIEKYQKRNYRKQTLTLTCIKLVGLGFELGLVFGSLVFGNYHKPHDWRHNLKVTDIVLRNSGTSFNFPHCSYKLYSRLSIDVFFATAIDMFCSVIHICYLIWFDLLSFFST